MNRFLRFCLCLVAAPILAAGPPPPVIRNFWDTNANARLVVASGTNCTVTFTTSGADTRTYTVDIPWQTFLTNGLASIGVASNSIVGTVTNGSVITLFIKGTLTNNTSGASGLATNVVAGTGLTNSTITGTSTKAVGLDNAQTLTLIGIEASGTLGTDPNAGHDSVAGYYSDKGFTGNAFGLTNLNASQLTSGTVGLAQLPGVAILTNANTFTGQQTIPQNGLFVGTTSDPTNAVSLPPTNVVFLIASQSAGSYFTNTATTNSIGITLTLPVSGKYKISAFCPVSLLGGSVNQSTNWVAIFRTNNTPAFIKWASIQRSAASGTFESPPIQVTPFLYSASAGDVLAIYSALVPTGTTYCDHDSWISAEWKSQ